MERGLVSTVIPVFNRPIGIQEAVASVVAQTYRPVEIIIVDDGSMDGTGSAIHRMKADYREIKQVLKTNRLGPGGAREQGRLKANGEFIQYLDSDDILLPRKFEIQVRGLKQYRECGVAYGKTRHYHRTQPPKDIAWKRTGEKIDFMFPAFLKSRWWGTSTPLYRREVVDRAGPWLSLWNEEDWEYDCRIASQGVRLHWDDEFVSDQRWDDSPRLSRGGSIDPDKLTHRAQAHERIFRHAGRYGIGAEAPEMQHFARELFLLSRQCGAASLRWEARRLFSLARLASTERRRNAIDFRVYAIITRCIGWKNAGVLASKLDAIKSGAPGME